MLLHVPLLLPCSHCLFGRNWGCAPGKEFKNLHFELCYYQAIEEAIQRKLPRVEAGAQGEHKLQRGLLPNFTYSAHYLPDPMMQAAVQKFLDKENAQVSDAAAVAVRGAWDAGWSKAAAGCSILYTHFGMP